MVKIRTSFEQPVSISSILSFAFVLAGLCLLLLETEGVASAALSPSLHRQLQPQDQHQQQQPDDGGTSPPHSSLHRPLCPDGWVRGSTGDQSFKDKDTGLCLYLSPQTLSWSQARAACHAEDSALVSLDSVLNVEDRLFQQYLKDKGVSDVWTGMHKVGGRQIWDEPGKGMVIAYRGPQRAVGVAKRGWSWDTSSFSDARLTCGLYGYTADTPLLSAQRRRRDTDTPSPAMAASKSSSDAPNREDSPHKDAKGPTEKNLENFKSFLSDQGMMQFADKINDSPSDKTKDTHSDKTSDFSSDKKNGSPSGKAKDAANNNNNHNDHHNNNNSGKTNESPPDKNGDNPADKSNNNRPSDKPSDSQSPSDDNNNNNNGAANEPRNNTTDRVSSDEEDSNHEMTKRSTPTVRVVTTEDPGALRNANDSGNSTGPTPASTEQPKASSQPSIGNSNNNTAAAADHSLKSPQRNDTSAGLFGGSSGFSQELMDFFRTDSRDSSNGGNSNAKSGADTANVPLTPREFIQRFQTGISNQLAGSSAETSSNETQVVSPTATAAAQSTTPASTDSVTTKMSDRVGEPSLERELNTFGKDSFDATPNSAWVTSSKSTSDPTTTGASLGDTTTTAGKLFEQGGTTQTPVVSSNNDEQPLFRQQSAPNVTGIRDGVRMSTDSPLPSNTTDSSSSEEDTTANSSSAEHTNTTASPTGMEDSLFFDAGPTTATSSFRLRFGSSSNTTIAPGSSTSTITSTSTAGSSSEERNLTDVSAEDTTAGSLRLKTTTPFDSSEELFGDPTSTTPASNTQANTSRLSTGFGGPSSPSSAGSSSSETTATSAEESGEVTNHRDATTSTRPSVTTPGSSSSSEEKSQPPQEQRQGTTLAQLRDVLDSITPSPGHAAPPAGHSWMSLQQCQSRHQFVCAAKPVEDFLPMDKCDDGWLGHRLVSRCYYMELELKTMSDARAHCSRHGGVLATVDTAFYNNVTALLLDRVSARHSRLGSRVWVEAPDSGQDGQCSVMEARGKGVQRAPCDSRLPYFCQRPANPPLGLGAVGDEDDSQILDKPPAIRNMSSWAIQPLICPLQMRRDDLVIWYKDGQPIPSDSEDTTTAHSTNTRNPNILILNTDLLRRLGVTSRRLQQPALLQGLYWCRVWRHRPLRSLTSRTVYVRFQDVITLQGFIKTSDLSVAEAVFYNEMDDQSGLTGTIGRSLQQMSDSIHPGMQIDHPFLSDIITRLQHADPETDEVEFRTYLCLSTDAMAPQDKGAVVDSFLKALHTELIASEDTVRRDWNLSLPFDQAFRLLMTEMCPEALLVDKTTGNEATFPSTPVNQHAVSVESCDGLFTGYALCSGDLRSGARWSHWEVETSCYDTEPSTDSNSDDTNKPKTKINPEDVMKTGGGFVLPTKPKPGLLNIDEVHIEQENVADVTDRLSDILDTSVELTDVDVGIVADVIGRVSLVPKLPEDVGLTLIKTVNRVLDSPLQTLQMAQRRTQASTRILQDLDKFSEKLDFGRKSHVRYVTANVVMDVWNMRTAQEPVIGLAATLGANNDSPLSESRIMTLSNRTWNDLHLANFDVAIELPDQLVSGDGVGSGRLSMVIYRKAGLFLSSLQSDDDDDDDSTEDDPLPELNSAIISATLASHSVTNLQDKVKLIFRPVKVPGELTTRCVYWDFTLPAGGDWSSEGCVYNGTLQGRDICLCDHLTNFAVLLDFYGDTQPIDEANDTALSIITIVGLSLSILGLALTVVTFIFFKKLRQGRAQQTLFNMSVALLCSEVVVLVGLKQTTNYGVCLAVAVLLHYFILVSFLWMLIEAVLQYLTFVKVLGTYISKYTLKTVLPAWGIPLIPVISVLATDYRQYRGRRDYCWMNLDTFYYAFALPVGVIVLFNLVTFIVIMFSLLRRPEGLRSTRNKGNAAETNIKAAFTIFILLGLTWIFGYLAIADARLPFQYMFTLFSSLQGFLIFVLLVARRRQFREQWRTLCCGQRGQARGQKVTPTLSNSTSSQSSQSSGSSFTASSRSRSSSGGSSKTLHSLIKRADSSVSKSKVQPQLSSSRGPVGVPR